MSSKLEDELGIVLRAAEGIRGRDLKFSDPSKKATYLQQVETDVAVVSLMHRVQHGTKKNTRRTIGWHASN